MTNQIVQTNRIIGGLCAGTLGVAAEAYVGMRAASVSLLGWLLILVAICLFGDALHKKVGGGR